MGDALAMLAWLIVITVFVVLIDPGITICTVAEGVVGHSDFIEVCKR